MHPPPHVITALVTAALAEDIGGGDITAIATPAQQLTAHLICRERAVLCGVAWFVRACELVDAAIKTDWARKDGDALRADDLVCTLSGPARALLGVERTGVNLLQTLSATATAANAFARAVAGTDCRILDTRKTLPGMRAAQKYAVRIGGAHNHRAGLFDGVLIKENHITASGSIKDAVAAARAGAPDCESFVVEVESIAQLEEALAAEVRHILLDNFSLAQLKQAVQINNARAELEASGNVTLNNAREIALTGVNAISVGAMTKHVRAVDFSMQVLQP